MTSQADNKKTQGKSAAAYLLLPMALAGLLAMLGAATYPSAGELPAQKSPATSKAAGRAHALNLPASAAVAAVPNPSPDLDSRLKELEATQKALYSSWLDGQRKTIDWWLAFLAIMMGVLALAGVAIPYLMGRKDKELMTQLLKEADKAVADAQQQLHNIKTAALEVGQHRERARADAAAIAAIKDATSGQEQTEEKKSELAAAAKQVKEDPQASQSDKLRAEAVQAATDKDTEKAYRLWAAVVALEPTDHVAQFNTGYWAQMQAEKETETPQRTRFWLQEAARAYAQALQIKPDMHAAASNWGSALNDEAQALAGSDLPAARALWLQAGQRYAQALQIKPDKHEAASNWGIALVAEAKALAAGDLPAARALWLQAGQRYAQTLQIKPDMHDAAFNWGHALAAEAQALAGCDLPAARVLWLQAGRRYGQALQIKPDMHEAAQNWGNALMHEWSALVATDTNAASEILERAITLLQSHAQSAPAVVAYNLACCFALKGDVPEALKWLDCDTRAGTLPAKLKTQTDKGFDGIRDDSRFIAWFNKLEK